MTPTTEALAERCDELLKERNKWFEAWETQATVSVNLRRERDKQST